MFKLLYPNVLIWREVSGKHPLYISPPKWEDRTFPHK